jgi:general secretion pathway protein G
MATETGDAIRRTLTAVAVGVVVAASAYWCGYRMALAGPYFCYEVKKTHRDLSLLHELVEEHRQTTGQVPATLTEIELVKESFRLNDSGQVIDPWKHPYQYRVEGDGFTLFSFGRDGQQGGEGDDADIYLGRPIQRPSLYRFTFEMPTGGIQATCVLASVCAGLICLLPPRNHSRAGLLVRIVATVVGCVWATVMIVVAHFMSGH